MNHFATKRDQVSAEAASTETRLSIAVAGLFSAVFAAVAIRYATFIGAIADGSGYISQAGRWLGRTLFGPFPFTSWPVGVDPALFVPLGYRLGVIDGTDVFTYPPGLPLLLSPAMAIGGELGPHLVPPLFGAVLVWATGSLAAGLGGPKARVIATGLMATCAIALTMATQPMSDVPAAAMWATALVFALRPTMSASAAAAAAICIAVLVRPNLAPLAIVPLMLTATARGKLRLTRMAIVATGGVAGIAFVMWTQQAAYGSAFESGHPGIEQLFSTVHITDNLMRYVRWYADAHTPVVIIALVAPLVFWRAGAAQSRNGSDASPRTVACTLLGFAALVYAAYLPYYPYTDWQFLRFMLPAIAALYALTAAVFAYAIDRLTSRARWVVVALLLVGTAGVQAKQTYETKITETVKWTYRVRTAVRYLDEVLPSKAIVITFFHSGSIKYYTGADILRPDVVAAGEIDALVTRLQTGGYRVFLLLDEDLERPGFQAKFAGTSIGRLDWSPRARIGTYGRIDLYDLADRQSKDRGERWTVDVLK